MSLQLSISLVACGALGLGLVTYFLCRLAIRQAYLPAKVLARSSHAKTTSRGGGLAMLVPFIAASLLCLFGMGYSVFAQMNILLILSIGALALGWADDRYGLPAAGKFLGQGALAAVFVMSVGGINMLPLPFVGAVDLGILGVVLGVFWIISFINVFNFMDGLNGMAAGAALVAVVSLLLAGAMIGRADLVIVSMFLTGVLGGFFIWNYPHGKIFMGDSGSHGLGFFFAGLAIILAQQGNAGALEFIFLPVIFLPFILDVTFTLIGRILRRAPIHQAHKEHFYQRLQQRGMSHGGVTAIYMGLCTLCALVAGVIGYAPDELKWLGPLALACFMIAAALLFISNDTQDRKEPEADLAGARDQSRSGQSSD